MDRLEAMHVFVAVAELRGFAPAARRLKLSPSAVTRMVAGLEDHLGARLLQRTTRSVTLTDVGAQYLSRARRILADVDEAEDAAQAERTIPSGTFTVTAPNVFGRMHVAPAFCRYLAQFPTVVGELSLADRMVNLVDEGVDCAVRIGMLDDSSAVARQVGLTRRVVVGAPRYLDKHKKVRVPDDVRAHDVIHFTALTPQPEWPFRTRGEDVRVAVRPRMSTNSADAAVAHAALGGGLALVLAYQAADAIRSGKLRVVLAEHEPPPLPIHIVYPSSRLLSAKVRAFIDLVSRSCDWRFTDL